MTTPLRDIIAVVGIMTEDLFSYLTIVMLVLVIEWAIGKQCRVQEQWIEMVMKERKKNRNGEGEVGEINVTDAPVYWGVVGGGFVCIGITVIWHPWPPSIGVRASLDCFICDKVCRCQYLSDSMTVARHRVHMDSGIGKT